jgi:hypothetical protein
LTNDANQKKEKKRELEPKKRRFPNLPKHSYYTKGGGGEGKAKKRKPGIKLTVKVRNKTKTRKNILVNPISSTF